MTDLNAPRRPLTAESADEEVCAAIYRFAHILKLANNSDVEILKAMVGARAARSGQIDDLMTEVGHRFPPDFGELAEKLSNYADAWMVELEGEK